MSAMIIPERTWGDTAYPLTWQAQDAESKVFFRWESGKIRIRTLQNVVVVDNVDVDVTGANVTNDDKLSWPPVYGSGANQIPEVDIKKSSVIYLVQFTGIVLGAPDGKNVQKSVERSWRILRAI